MDKDKCTSCKKTVGSGATRFKCPKCGKVEIIRCKKCKKLSSKYKCSACEFEGPN